MCSAAVPGLRSHSFAILGTLMKVIFEAGMAVVVVVSMVKEMHLCARQTFCDQGMCLAWLSLCWEKRFACVTSLFSILL